MVRANVRFFDEREMIKHVMREAKKTGNVRGYVERSGIMPIADKDEKQKNLVTGRLLRNKTAQEDLLFHSIGMAAIEAAVYAWNHPEKLRFKRFSPLGEGKDINNPKDVKNLKKKKKRGAIGYNQYEFKYKNKKYLIKLEVRKKCFEVPYHIR